MSELKTLHQPKTSESHVSKSVQRVLADTYGLYLATHNYHWNVEGSNFVSLHNLFGDQYNELFLSIDIIAEHIRTLDSYAMPFEGDEIIHILKAASNATNKEVDVNAKATRMVHNLIDMNESVIASCQSAKEKAHSEKDDETVDLMVTRITAHQKALWMLRSVIK